MQQRPISLLTCALTLSITASNRASAITPIQTFPTPQSGTRADWSKPLGDLPFANSAGVNEVMVGDPINEKVYIYSGGNLLAPVLTITSPFPAGNWFACSGTNLGDLNNDGFEDFFIAVCPKNPTTLPWTGAIYSGANGQFFGNTPKIMNPAVNNQFLQKIETTNAVTIGDSNLDGLPEVAIANLRTHTTLVISPFEWVSGNPTFTASIKWSATESDSDYIADIDTFYAYSIAALHDVNADGFKDFAVTATDWVEVGPAGISSTLSRVYIYSGNNFSRIKVIDANELDNHNVVDFSILNASQFASQIRSVNDLTGDGVPDLVISSLNYNRYDLPGFLFIFSGKLSDLNATNQGFINIL